MATEKILKLGHLEYVKDALDLKANDSDISTVGKTGSYNDLTNKPTIPSVYNATVTLTQDGATKGSFTVNQNSNVTIDLDDNDTHYESKTITGASSTATSNAAATQGNLYLNHIENGSVKSSHKIVGEGAVSVFSNASGQITVSAPSVTNTDRYVNSASFADDTSSTPNSPVKMTLTRAGSDTAQINANLPKVTSSSAGVVPKGSAVTSQSQTTKFLREDGTWSAPTYTSVTSTYSSTGTTAVNGTAVASAIASLPQAMVFKGTVGSSGATVTTLPVDGSASIGDTYKAITNGTYGGKSAKIGDVLVCLTKTSTANTWELIPSGDEPSGTVTSVKINATSPISIDSSSAITTSGERTISHATSGATAGSYGDSSAQTPSYGGTFKVPYVTVNNTGHVTGISEHTVKIPASDNTNTTYTLTQDSTDGHKITLTPSSGTATTITIPDNNTTYSTGVGLTNSGTTFKAKLKSETASTLDSASIGSTANRQYAVGVDKSGYLSVNVPWTDTQPTVNNGTLTIQKNGTNITTFSANQSGNATANITIPTSLSGFTNDLYTFATDAEVQETLGLS